MQKINNSYNPFFLIDYHNNETFHSKLLKLFLDVNNSSNAKDFEKEYLRVFIQLLNKIKPDEANEIAEYDEEKDGFFFIHNEYSIDSAKDTNNYFDVFISYGTTAIVIENKLDSSEGENQVARYLNWLNKSSNLPGIDKKNRHLIYLKKDKRAHNPRGVNIQTLNKLSIDESYIESLQQLETTGLITLNWTELAQSFAAVDITSFQEEEDSKTYFFKVMIEHLKLNFFESKNNISNDIFNSTTKFFEKLKSYLTKDEKTIEFDFRPIKYQNTGKFDLVLKNNDWILDGIQLYIIIYRHNSLGVFCGIASEDRDLALDKGLIHKNTIEYTKDRKYIRFIPQKKIVKSSEILITGKNNKGDFEAHSIDFIENQEKYINEVQKRVNRIILLINNEKEIANQK